MNFLKRLSMHHLERKVKAAAREVRPGLSLLLEAEFETLKQAVLDEAVRRLAEVPAGTFTTHQKETPYV